ncbi:MAG: DNA-binding protein [Oscillospiraceae bacterium]|nr:DNA-binding protein [Oscillospiraceae bacterium]
MSEERKLICSKCGAELVKRQVMFSYMRRTFGHEVPVCPKCGKAYISRELAEGKMAEVEVLLEDK